MRKSVENILRHIWNLTFYYRFDPINLFKLLRNLWFFYQLCFLKTSWTQLKSLSSHVRYNTVQNVDTTQKLHYRAVYRGCVVMRVCNTLKVYLLGTFAQVSVLELCWSFTGSDALDICHRWTVNPPEPTWRWIPRCLRLNIVLFAGVLGQKFRALIFVQTAFVVCRGKRN